MHTAASLKKSAKPLTHEQMKHRCALLEQALKKAGAMGENAIKQGRRLPVVTRIKYLTNTLQGFIDLEAEKQKYIGNELPVGVREFLTSPKYMNKAGVLWPKVIDEIEEACSGKYVEGVFTGGIGCAKSTAALYIQAYLLYQLSRMKNPHGEFGLDPASEIMIIFQSLNAATAKTVEFDRFKEMIEGSPYFKRHFQHDPNLKTSLRFPNRIVVKAVSGDAAAAIGQNVISAIIDEVNFMSVIEKSKQSHDGGAFNQAIELYNSIVRRRESRFMQSGKVWGLLCLVSSARFPGQFTDKRKEASQRQLARTGTTNIYIYDKRAWEVMDPEHKSYSYTGKWFRVFLGDMTRKPFIMADNDDVDPDDEHLVMPIPVEHFDAFENDIYDAIRDIAGMATLAAHPFIPYPEKVNAAFGQRLSIFSVDSCDMVKLRPMIYPKRFTHIDKPRYAHIDLSQSGDSTGVAVGYVSGFEWITRSEGEKELLPVIEYDALLEIKPPKNGEVDYGEVRGILYKLRSMGLPLKWITLDGFNSFDFIQIVRQKGYVAGQVSMDITPVPYEILKQALIDGRIKCPEHQKCQMELVTLERDPATGKIDHTEVSSKDVSDAMAGVAYGLTMRREIWATYGIRPDRIPQSIKDAVQTNKSSMEGNISK